MATLLGFAVALLAGASPSAAALVCAALLLAAVLLAVYPQCQHRMVAEMPVARGQHAGLQFREGSFSRTAPQMTLGSG